MNFSYTTLKILLGTSLLGLAAGLLGLFLILKKQALIGDALSHTVLPGIVVFYFFAQNIDLWVLWFGSIFSMLIALALMELIKKYSKIQADTYLSLILASFFGLGNVLIAKAQSTNQNSDIATLEKFILGQTALMSQNDVFIIGIVALIVFLVIVLLWKEFKIFVFDQTFAQSIGFSTFKMQLILNFLLISVIIVSLKVVGIILTSAFLILPGVVSRQCSDKLLINSIIASLTTFISVFMGVIWSNQIPNMPTGPSIILFLALFVILALFFAPKHGMLNKHWQQLKYRQKIKKFCQLIHFYYQNTYFQSQELPPFLFQDKYLQIIKNKIIITDKGINLVHNLIDGKIK